ncbi:MAG TPA: universal stress protein [Terracidiphilus sp.]|nr:universal stress protein [Terracidiphilus sp.]
MPMIGDRPEVNVDTVIYATDFGAAAENAGTYARLLADACSATLVVVHAFLLDQAATEAEIKIKTASRQREHLQHLLVQRAAALSPNGTAAVPLLLEGIPHVAIPRLAEKRAPSLIVLGTHGAGRLEHGLIGSVAERILRSTRWPCLTVGPLARRAPMAGELPFHRILFATDLESASPQAAMFAIALAEEVGAELHVMNAVPGGEARHAAEWTEAEKRYRRKLEELVPRQARDFCSPSTFVEIGSAHDRIIGHIQEHGVDLLVLGVHKSSHLGLTMRTSGAYRVIADAPCPVLTITE